MPQIAVIGAGLQGSLIALELAKRGGEVSLFDRADRAISQASRWNEGKLHLGFVYCLDPSLKTAELMMTGAADFFHGLEEITRTEVGSSAFSSPFVYARHRDSRVDADELGGYYAIVAQKLQANSEKLGSVLQGRAPRVKRLSKAELEQKFDPAVITDAWQTPEVSIHPGAVSEIVESRIFNERNLELLLSTEVWRIEKRGSKYRLFDNRQKMLGEFDIVVNASWESRLRLDRTLGIPAPGSIVYRYKSGLFFDPGQHSLEVSSTVVNGPFGDVVSYNDGRAYLSWYPVGCTYASRDLYPGALPEFLQTLDHGKVAKNTLDAWESILPIDPRDSTVAVVGGGVICSSGVGDFNDRSDKFHARYACGPYFHGNYCSVDTGKYTTAPHFAMKVADQYLCAQIQ